MNTLNEISAELPSLSIHLKNDLDSISHKLKLSSNELNMLGNAVEIIAKAYSQAEQNIFTSETGNVLRETEPPLACPTDAEYEEGYVPPEQEFAQNHEYTYSEDNIQVPICAELMNKDYCIAMAERIVEEHGKDGKCNGMSVKRIAKEIYAHALGYYLGSDLDYLGLSGDFADTLMEHGEIADVGLGDGLDFHYNLLWYLCDPFDLNATYY